MSTLPSYEEATRQLTWMTLVPLVAPYISNLRDLKALSRVSRSFRHVFQPLIWHSPIETARMAGLLNETTIGWWMRFPDHLKGPRCSERARGLARVLDTRYLSTCIRALYTGTFESIQDSFDYTVDILPDLRCLLADGRDDSEKLKFKARFEPPGKKKSLRLLSWVNLELEMRRVSYWYFSDLVYLDISTSNAEGGQCTMFTIEHEMLPSLRLLRMQGRKLEDLVAPHIFSRFSCGQLWSLDVSRNRLTDKVIDDFFKSFNLLDLTESPNETHGLPLYDEHHGHPTRYFAYPPPYNAAELQDDFLGHGRRIAHRNTGVDPIKRNDLESMVQQLGSDDPHLLADILQAPRGLTHLDLSGNQFTAFGIERLLRGSRGHLQSLSCDNMTLVARPRKHTALWPSGAELYGVLDMADALRPAISVNLQKLCIHHSLVTQIPTLSNLNLLGWSPLEKLYFAETAIRSHCEAAFPGAAFVPDTNPRLTSLTLTGIPWVSAGPLTDKLLGFIKMLAVQERDIQDLHGPPSCRRVSVLRGLRQLTLEFDPSPMASRDMEHSYAEDFELEGLTERPFRFIDFGEKLAPLTEDEPESDDESMNVDVDPTQRSNKKEWETAVILDAAKQRKSVKVWVGYSIAHRYRDLVKTEKLRYNLALATPAQVRAGVPEGAYVWQTAWHAAVMPSVFPLPSRDETGGMKPVIDAIKEHRRSGRAEYEGNRFRISSDDVYLYWTGNLQVVYN